MNTHGSQPAVRALVVDDDLVVRLGLISLLQSSGRVAVTGDARNGEQALELARRLRPDVVLLDLDMPLYEGLRALPELSKICKILTLTSRDDAGLVNQALRLGATGCLVHRQFTAGELANAVVSTARGRAHLSPGAVTALAQNLRSRRSPYAAHATGDRRGHLSRRELEIMDHIARGRTNPDIAQLLVLSEKTVKNHVNRIYSKLKVRSRAEAVSLWLGARAAVE